MFLLLFFLIISTLFTLDYEYEMCLVYYYLLLYELFGEIVFWSLNITGALFFLEL